MYLFVKNSVTLWCSIFVIYNTINYGACFDNGTHTILPDFYSLELVLENDSDNSFYGNVNIEFKCMRPTKLITLNADNLKIDDDSIKLYYISNDLTSTNHIIIKNKTLNNTDETYTLTLQDEITFGSYELHIAFAGGISSKESIGLYKVVDGDFNRYQNRLILTDLKPNFARKLFPCFDDARLKSKFKIIVGHREEFEALSNMPKLHVKSMKDKPNWKWSDFQESLYMSTDSVAVAVFEKLKENQLTEGTYTDFNLNIWTRENDTEKTDFALKTGYYFKDSMKSYLNKDFPLPKLDLISLTHQSKDYINSWGLARVKSTSLLYDSDKSTLLDKERTTITLSNLISEQWIGNLVTPKHWSDKWQFDGLAELLGLKMADTFKPQWKILESTMLMKLLKIFNQDSLISSQSVNANKQIGNDKPILLLNMIESFIGEKAFQQGVTNYLNHFAYDSAEVNDLWDELTNEAHLWNHLDYSITIEDVLKSWTNQSGYPIITVERDYESQVVSIKQERFNPTLDESVSSNSCWSVPLTYITANKASNSNDSIPKYWLNCNENDLTDKLELVLDVSNHDWILFNNKVAGLYRVNYDVSNWKMLIRALKTNHTSIPLANRVQLISDAFALASTNQLDYEIVFDMLQYLEKETDYIALQVVLDQLNYLELMLRRTSTYEYLEKFMQNLLTPVYKNIVKFEEHDNVLEAKRISAVVTAACRYSVSDCQQMIYDAFQRWKIASSHNQIPKDYQNLVFCVAMQMGNETDWDFLYQNYIKTNDESEKLAMLSAMGCTKKVSLLNRMLEWSISDKRIIHRNHFKDALHAVAKNVVGFYVFKEFLYYNFEKIKDYLYSSLIEINSLLKYISEQISKEEELSQFTQFLNKEEVLGITDPSNTKQQLIEQARINVNWFKKFYKRISSTLEEITHLQ